MTAVRAALALAFPGRRAVWWGALAATVLTALLVGRMLVTTDPPLTGTNSVGVGTIVAGAQPGERVCVRDLDVPAGTDRVGLFLSAPGGRATLSGSLGPQIAVPRQDVRTADPFVELALGGRVERRLDDAALCLVSEAGPVSFGGANVMRLPGAAVSDVAGEGLDTLGRDVAVRYIADGGPAFAGRLGDAFERAALFKPFGAAAPLLALLALLASVYVVVRIMATVQGRSARSLSLRAYGLALVGAASFAVLLPVFGGPDESEHVAYAVHVAAAGERADAPRTTTPPYSGSQLRLMEALHHNSTILNASSRPRWDIGAERDWAAARVGTRDDDGGGYSDSATGHSPLYYGVVSVPYRLFSGVSGDAVFAMRIWNALFASLIAGLAVLCASMLAPRSPAVWWLAGVLVASQPVFASVSGSVNNDTFVNLFGALALTLLVAAYVRGPTRGRMVGLGVAVALLPLAKATGFALWPVIAGAGALVLWRHRAAWRTGLLAPAAALGTLGIWVAAGGDVVNTHPVEAATAAGGPSLADRVSYLAEMVVPVVQLTGNYWSEQSWGLREVYVDRGYNLFGWPTASMTQGIADLVLAALIVGWILVACAAWRARGQIATWGGPVAILAAAVLAVLSLVAYAYTAVTPRETLGEQGRYIFPALVALAVLFALGATALRARSRDLYLGVATAGSTGLMLIAYLSVLRGLYS